MRIALTFFAVFVSLALVGQNTPPDSSKLKQPFIYLNKIGGRFQLKIYEDEYIRFKLKGTDIFFSGQIEYFKGQKFSVHQTEIPISEITEIDIRNMRFTGRNTAGSSGKIIAAGIILPVITLLNGENPLLGNFVFIPIGLLVGGVVLRLMHRKSFEPKSGFNIVIIHP